MNPWLYLLESNLLVRKRIRERQQMRDRRSVWVHELYTKRDTLGEFHHLFEDLIQHPDKFFKYFRMKMDTFYYILDAIRYELTKTNNFRKTIPAEERLAVTLR